MAAGVTQRAGGRSGRAFRFTLDKPDACNDLETASASFHAPPYLPLAAFSALSLILTSCDTHGSAGLSPGDAPSPAALAAVSAPLRDGGIDATDTHLVMETTEQEVTTVTMDTPLYDPRTGQQTTTLTLDDGPENQRIEAGYGSDGLVRISQYVEDAPLDPYTNAEGEGQSARLVGATVTVFNAAGQPIQPVASTGIATDLHFEDFVPSDADIVGGSVIDPEALPPPGTTRVTLSDGRSAPLRWMGKDRFELAAGALPPSDSVRERSVQRYRRAPGPDGRDVFVLAETETEREVTARGQRLRTRATMTVRALRWHRDRGRDNGRRLRRNTAHPTPPAPMLHTPIGPRLATSCPVTDPECDTGGGSGGGGTGSGLDPCPAVPSGAAIVWQHGFFSDASIWGGTGSASDGTRGQMRCRYAFSAEVARSMPDKGLNSHASQTAILKSDMAATGKNAFVLVGHSQGGLISRHAAQEFAAQGRPDMTRAVVTVGTPHQGALLAHNLRPGFQHVAAGWLAYGTSCSGTSVLRALVGSCYVREALLGTVITGFLGGMLNVAYDAPGDLVPGSAAMQRLSRPEAFLKYGIQHYPPKRWIAMRLAGDLLGGVTPDGAAWARTTEWAYRALRLGGIVGWLIPGAQAVAAALRAVASVLDTFDATWNLLTSLPGQASDGVVQGPSQIYPSATRNYERRTDATSHLGETRTEATRTVLRDIFDSELVLTKRSAGGGA